jgi:YbbR domain-containing protein
MRQPRAAVLQGVLSLVLALALWTFVSFTQNPTDERRFSVPLATSNLPNGLMVVRPETGLPGDIETVVDVLVAGPRVTLDEGPRVNATVDLSDLSAGTHMVPVDIDTQGGVRAREYEPQTVTVRLAPSATQTFPVTPLVVNQPPFAEPEDDAISVDTKQASVNGPQEAVARVAQVQLRIDLQGRLQSYAQSLPLEAVDQNGESVLGVTVAPTSTHVTVNIEPHIEPQQVSVVPQFVGQPPAPYVVQGFDWTPKSVEVIAPVVITSTLQTEPIVLNERTESFTQTVRLVNVDGMMTRLPNDTVTVEVRIAEVAVRSNTLLFIPTVEPQNLAADLRIASAPQELRVRVSGTYQQFNQLAGTTVRAVVDLAGRGPGSYTLPVEIELPDGVRIVGDPPQVTITLVEVPPPTPTPPQASPPVEGG